MYSLTGAQTYTKVCHTYSAAKEYAVRITTPERITYLDLSSQNVNEFEAGTNGTNLIYISLDDNALDSLAGGTFRGLTQLRELYLSNNAFVFLPQDIFQ
ncbi:MAG: leucine-rich repeat domain-containing protein [Candidatus Peribacteria bacterium]|nr:leucine-rich repeat domain-containing protein [Candidatus Peribacteria bacterium]